MDAHDLITNALVLTALALVLYLVASFRAGGAIDFPTVGAASPRLVLVVLVFAFAAISAAMLAFSVATDRGGSAPKPEGRRGPSLVADRASPAGAPGRDRPPETGRLRPDATRTASRGDGALSLPVTRGPARAFHAGRR